MSIGQLPKLLDEREINVGPLPFLVSTQALPKT
jgi:hypothetical protein